MTRNWADIPAELPDDFEDRELRDQIIWLSNQVKKPDIRAAVLEEIGVDDPYGNPTKGDWARIFAELRCRRLEADSLTSNADNKS